MSNGYCILTLEKVHSMGNLQIRHEHNFRDLNLKHVDITASENNEELVNTTGMDYKELWYRRAKEVELETGNSIKVRKGQASSVIAYELVTSFSKDADVDIEAWKAANVKWMKDTFGERNVLSMQVHNDETTPHIHSIVIPIDERGHLCARTFTGGRKKMFDLQTSYGEAMEPLGLKRGELYSKSKKTDLTRFYKLLNKAADAHVPEIKAGETVTAYVERVNTYLQEEQMKAFSRENDLRRRLELAYTYNAQHYAHYREAIRLQQDIEENLGGDKELVRQRIIAYRKMENAVPKKTLVTFLKNLQEKFPIDENLLRIKDEKRKKKKEKADTLETNENV